MSKLAALIAKHKLEEDDILDIMEHVKKAGSERAGIESWYNSLVADVEDIRFQLTAKGHDVGVIKHEVDTGEA